MSFGSRELEDQFDWNEEKSSENKAKHGVSFYEAMWTFADPGGFQMVDIKHSTDSERRFYWVGRSLYGRVLTTWFTYRKNQIRIIGSAEFRKFRRLYHERTTT